MLGRRHFDGPGALRVRNVQVVEVTQQRLQILEMIDRVGGGRHLARHQLEEVPKPFGLDPRVVHGRAVVEGSEQLQLLTQRSRMLRDEIGEDGPERPLGQRGHRCLLRGLVEAAPYLSGELGEIPLDRLYALPVARITAVHQSSQEPLGACPRGRRQARQPRLQPQDEHFGIPRRIGRAREVTQTAAQALRKTIAQDGAERPKHAPQPAQGHTEVV